MGDEPQAVMAWQGEMTQAQSALAQWANVAADWEVHARRDAELAQTEQKARDSLALARKEASRLLPRPLAAAVGEGL